MDPFVDNELSLETSLTVERHLAGCSDCSIMYENRQKLRRAIQSGTLYKSAPEGLQSRLMSSIHIDEPQTRGADGSVITAKYATLRRLAFAAALVLVALVSWSIGKRSTSVPQDSLVAKEVFSSDIRSLMATDHGIDIISSNQHTVKPWFAGKLDFSPPVEDLAGDGFPLIGGRSDYVDGRNVAAIVYKRRKHWITLYIWPSTDVQTRTARNSNGYNLVHWSSGSMTYWAVSDVNVTELTQFAKLVESER
jgi:anti-sigma factor RsiW